MSQVILEKVVKAFGKTEVVHGIDLEIKTREFAVLVGPSGCGKSTVLRMIAGLEPITGGTIQIGDRMVNDVAPKDRSVAMVFQNYALYPHMNVFNNMSFGLKLRKTPKPEIENGEPFFVRFRFPKKRTEPNREKKKTVSLRAFAG